MYCFLVYEVVIETEQLRMWCCACDCHEEDLRQRKHVDCWMKSRRINGLRERLELSYAYWGCCLEEFDFCGDREAAGHGEWLCSSLRGQLQLKMAFLEHLPYLLLRVDLPAVAKQCLADYDRDVEKFGEDQVHRVSRRFLSRSSQYRVMIEARAA
jgi:hypothetical protein